MDDIPLQPGNTMNTAMLSMCVGGLLRTWTEDGSSRLWSVQNPEVLHAMQGAGLISRTMRRERRLNESALLLEDSGVACLRARFPLPPGQRAEGGQHGVVLNVDAHKYQGYLLRLEPSEENGESFVVQVGALLRKAIHHALASGEVLIVEKGGWGAPEEPFCKFMVIAERDGPAVLIGTMPEPGGSPLWAPHIVPGEGLNCLIAPATREAVDHAPLAMLEAIATWGLQPSDLALTFEVSPEQAERLSPPHPG